MDENYIRKRITELRMTKGVSEYKMSLDLGHSRSYIQGIVSGRNLPSMSEFLYICEYLGVSPKEFFDEETNCPLLIKKANQGMGKLNDEDMLALIGIIDRLNKR